MTSDALRIRLRDLELSQVGAARALGIDPRTMRRYVAGALPVPRVIELALDGLAAKEKPDATD